MDNPPVVSLTSPSYGQKIGSDIPLLIKGSATDPDGISKIELYIDARVTGTSDAAQFQWTLNSIPFGTHTATILAIDTKGLVSEKTYPFTYYPVFPVPGKVEAEDFSNMSGITTQATTDTDGGFNVTSIGAADFMDYSLNILETGSYRVEFRVASATGGGKFELRKTTQFVLSSNTVDATGGTQKWLTIADTINLSAGKQTLRIHAVTGGWNMNWINFVKVDLTSSLDITLTDPGYSLSIVPNPVSSSFRVIYNVAELAPVEFMLYDENGRLVGKQKGENVVRASGENNWIANNSLISGTYFLCMHQNGRKVATTRFIKAQ